MLDLVKNMEPRFEYENTIIFKETDEVTEVLFFVQGAFTLGFEVNEKHHMVLRYENSPCLDHN